MFGRANLFGRSALAALAAALIECAFAGAAAAAAKTTDPTSVAAIIEKVKRGVVAIAPTEVTEVIQGTGGSIGSGFIISKEGHFMTNVHVLQGAAFAAVTLWDNTTYRGNLIAVDPGIDVAIGILEGCPKEKIFPVPLGDSDAVKPGELALAMGQPGDQTQMNVDPSDPFGNFGLKQSATVRVVAGKDTSMEFPLQCSETAHYYLVNYGANFGTQYGTNFTYSLRMQTPIAGGNSGGPLFNSKGEVIGINFLGGSTEVSQGSNWAIPINLAKEFYYSIADSSPDRPFIRHQARPWLGLDIVFPSSVRTPAQYIEFRERYRPKGKIIVYGVRKDSPADAAGFQKNDEILQVNGIKFESPEDLRIYVMERAIDEQLVFTVKRGETTSRITVKTDVKRNYDSEFSV
ncbi:MAG: trypsin-like peptidase domain-containing protein [bacterium]|jgi:serine protease Do